MNTDRQTQNENRMAPGTGPKRAKHVSILSALKAVSLAAMLWTALVTPGHGEPKDRAPAERGLSRTMCYRLRSLYGSGDPQARRS